MSVQPFQNRLAQEEPAIFFAEWHALAGRIGSTDGVTLLVQSAAAERLQRVNSLASLRRFLKTYSAEVLVPIELPAIQRAFLHASRGQARELIALDQELGGEPRLEIFEGASHRVGCWQLKRMRPLREHRLVQRYLAALESGQAQAWHTIVYGVMLATYSLPLRQGLMNYAEQTLCAFVNSASRAWRLPDAACQKLLGEATATLPAAVEDLLKHSEG